MTVRLVTAGGEPPGLAHATTEISTQPSFIPADWIGDSIPLRFVGGKGSKGDLRRLSREGGIAMTPCLTRSLTPRPTAGPRRHLTRNAPRRRGGAEAEHRVASKRAALG